MRTELPLSFPSDGLKRVIITEINPSVAGGRYPAKGTVNWPIVFSAAIFADGHAELYAVAQIKPPGKKKWQERKMVLKGNDIWEATYAPESVGTLEFRIQAWINDVATGEMTDKPPTTKKKVARKDQISVSKTLLSISIFKESSEFASLPGQFYIFSHLSGQ